MIDLATLWSDLWAINIQLGVYKPRALTPPGHVVKPDERRLLSYAGISLGLNYGMVVVGISVGTDTDVCF